MFISLFLTGHKLSDQFIDSYNKLFLEEVMRVVRNKKLSRTVFRGIILEKYQDISKRIADRGWVPDENNEQIAMIAEMIEPYGFIIKDNDIVNNHIYSRYMSQLEKINEILSSDPDPVMKELMDIVLTNIDGRLYNTRIYDFDEMRVQVENIADRLK